MPTEVVQANGLKTLNISAVHRKRLDKLIESIRPTPNVGATVETLIDQELERRGIDLAVNTDQSSDHTPSSD